MKNETEEVQAMEFENRYQTFINESRVVLFGNPTYCGTFGWQIKKLFDTTGIDLAGKLGSVFVTEDDLGGGADLAELGIIGMMLVRGRLEYTAGFTKGQPLTHLEAVAIKSGSEAERHQAQHLGKRLVEKAKEIFS